MRPPPPRQPAAGMDYSAGRDRLVAANKGKCAAHERPATANYPITPHHDVGQPELQVRSTVRGFFQMIDPQAGAALVWFDFA
jgi:hypothetical protein